MKDENFKDLSRKRWEQEMGKTMFHVVNAYTRAAQFEELAKIEIPAKIVGEMKGVKADRVGGGRKEAAAGQSTFRSDSRSTLIEDDRAVLCWDPFQHGHG